jgi:hypothetical protein
MPLCSLNGDFTFETFVERLRLFYNETNEEIRILAYITNLKSEELFNSMKRFGFDIILHGSVAELNVSNLRRRESLKSHDYSITTEPSNSVYYCYHDYERNLFLCFTSDTLEETEKTMGKFVQQRKGITSLWVRPTIFEEIKQKIIMQNEDSIISEFHASRFRLNFEDVIRQNYDRYFRYTGDDGRFTLNELTRAYGVLPTSLKFIIPNVCKFWITNKGKFTFIHGNIDFLFDIINDILSNVLKAKSLVDKARIEFIPVNLGKKEVKLPKVVPLEIVFSREIDYSEIEKLVDNMKGEDFNFEIYDMLLISGSVHLSGTVIDRYKNDAFNITGNLNKLTISPRKDTSFDSILQFYKLIIERLDLDARIQISNQLN